MNKELELIANVEKKLTHWEISPYQLDNFGENWPAESVITWGTKELTRLQQPLQPLMEYLFSINEVPDKVLWALPDIYDEIHKDYYYNAIVSDYFSKSPYQQRFKLYLEWPKEREQDFREYLLDWSEIFFKSEATQKLPVIIWRECELPIQSNQCPSDYIQLDISGISKKIKEDWSTNINGNFGYFCKAR